MIAFHHLSDAGDQKEKMKLVFAVSITNHCYFDDAK